MRCMYYPGVKVSLEKIYDKIVKEIGISKSRFLYFICFAYNVMLTFIYNSYEKIVRRYVY
jgi:hypothetical protein